MEAQLAHRPGAHLADPIGAVIDTRQSMLSLLEHIARIVGEGHLMLTLKCLTPGVRLIVSRTISGISDQLGDFRVGDRNLLRQSDGISIERLAHLGNLGWSPRRFIFTHR